MAVDLTTTGLPVYRLDTGLDFLTYSDYELDEKDPLAGGAAYVEDSIVPAKEARISLFDQGFIHSDVTYTVFHVWHGNAFRLHDHVERLFAHAEAMRIVPPMSKEQTVAMALELVRASQLREAFVNLTVTRGYSSTPAERDISKHRSQMYGYAVPYQWVPPFEGIEHGIPAMIAQTVRRSPRNVMDPQIKNFQWGDLIRAIHEATDRGGEALPILLDGDGLVAEGPGFNVLMVEGDTLLTPGRNALGGITRRTVMEIAAERGLHVAEADITTSRLFAADELMGSTTAGGVWPFVSLDGRPIGSGTTGLHTRAIIRRYWELSDEPSSLITPVQY